MISLDVRSVNPNTLDLLLLCRFFSLDLLEKFIDVLSLIISSEHSRFDDIMCLTLLDLSMGDSVDGTETCPMNLIASLVGTVILITLAGKSFLLLELKHFV
jgi:hypothetical protein